METLVERNYSFQCKVNIIPENLVGNLGDGLLDCCGNIVPEFEFSSRMIKLGTIAANWNGNNEKL